MKKTLKHRIGLFLLSISFIFASYVSVGDFYRWIEILAFTFIPFKELSLIELLKGVIFYVGVMFFLELVDIDIIPKKIFAKGKHNDNDE